MSVRTVPHLNFRGEARAALSFYRSVFGGEQTVVTYRDANAVPDPSEADQVMFGQVASPSGFCVMAFDVPSSRDFDPGTIPFFVSVTSESADETGRYWSGLSDGAVVLHPLGPAAWSPLYGMLKDRFGVTWIVSVAAGVAR